MKINYITIKNYQPEIDSLRAIAISLVVLFHFDLVFTSGFLGVDIFFVISGFLISKILEEINKEKNWVLLFFNKRIRRLLPALYLTIFLVIIFSIIIFSPFHLERLSKSALNSTLGISNFFYATETGYFDFEKNFKPLLHTWSLSVELQLYLIWFFIYFILIRNFQNYKYLIVISLIAISLFFSVIYSNRSPSFFYFTGFRIYEFGFGALAYYLTTKNKIKLFGDMSFLVSFISIITASVIFIPEDDFIVGAYDTFKSLSVVIPTFIIILSFNNLSIFRKFLTLKWLINLGKISYSLYLFHWPILIFFSYSGNIDITIIHKLFLITISLILSYISYNYIEIYFRKRSKNFNFSFKNKKLFITMVFSAFFLSVISINLFELKIKSQNFDKYNQIVFDQLKETKSLQKKYYSELNRKIYFNKSDKLKNILLIGDSHALDNFFTFKIIEKINKDSNLQFFPLGFGTCFEFEIKENFIRKFLKRILKSYDKNKFCNSLTNSPKLLDAISKADKIILSNRWMAETDFQKILDFFESKTKARLIFINRIDTYFDPPTLFYKNGLNTNKVAYFKRDKMTLKINDHMGKFLLKKNIAVIDRSNFFCKDTIKECIVYKNNKILFSDADHLTPEGYIYAASEFKNTKLIDLLF